MKSLEQLLTELRTLQEKLPADLQNKVGNVFLGGNADIAKLQGVKTPKGFDYPEKNTAWEDALQNDIEAWLEVSSPRVAKYFKKNKALLDQLAKEFPQALLPPIGQTAYRGTSIKLDSLEQAFRKKQFKVVRLAGREVFHFKNLDYSPNRPAQSWTINPRVAFKFEGRPGTSNVVPVVYATKVNKDFIFNPNLMNILFGQIKEDETVRVAEQGTFEAFVDSSAILNTWELEPKENFIHRLPSAKPYFDQMVEMYNKAVKAENKRLGEELFQPAATVEDIILFNTTEEGNPAGFDLNREYTKYAKKYKDSMKK
jgi:hypothetical protein